MYPVVLSNNHLDVLISHASSGRRIVKALVDLFTSRSSADAEWTCAMSKSLTLFKKELLCDDMEVALPGTAAAALRSLSNHWDGLMDTHKDSYLAISRDIIPELSIISECLRKNISSVNDDLTLATKKLKEINDTLLKAIKEDEKAKQYEEEREKKISSLTSQSSISKKKLEDYTTKLSNAKAKATTASTVRKQIQLVENDSREKHTYQLKKIASQIIEIENERLKYIKSSIERFHYVTKQSQRREAELMIDLIKSTNSIVFSPLFIEKANESMCDNDSNNNEENEDSKDNKDKNKKNKKKSIKKDNNNNSSNNLNYCSNENNNQKPFIVSATNKPIIYPASTQATTPPPGTKLRALRDHSSLKSKLVFHRNDIITLEIVDTNGFWTGSYNGVSGIFPQNYVEILCELPTSNSSNSSGVVSTSSASSLIYTPSIPNLARSISSISIIQSTNSINSDSLSSLSQLSFSTPKTKSIVQYKALFDFQGEHQDDLPFEKGDIILVSPSIPSSNNPSSKNEWLKGRCGMRSGNFPSNYVTEIKNEESRLPIEEYIETRNLGKVRFSAVVLFDYQSIQHSELSVKSKTEVIVWSKDIDGWSFCEQRDGKKGLIPTAFLNISSTNTFR